MMVAATAVMAMPIRRVAARTRAANKARTRPVGAVDATVAAVAMAAAAVAIRNPTAVACTTTRNSTSRRTAAATAP